MSPPRRSHMPVTGINSVVSTCIPPRYAPKRLFFPRISVHAQTKPALSLLEWFTSTQRHLRLNEVWGGPLRKHSRQVPTKRGLRPPAPVGLASRARKRPPMGVRLKAPRAGMLALCRSESGSGARSCVSRTDGVDGWLAGWQVASAWRCRQRLAPLASALADGPGR